MKKLDKKSLLGLVAVLSTFFAATVATSACYWFFYQPEEPKSLRNM